MDIYDIITNNPILKQIVVAFLMFLSLLRGLFGGPSCTEGEIEPRMVSRPIEVATKATCYALYVPDGYTDTQAWPVILFWHGKLESGTDGEAHIDVGIGPALREHPKMYPCLVAMPQLPWDGSLASWVAYFDAVLEDLLANYNVDEDRIYMTGISFGAGGTWHYAAKHPDLFAAIMPIAGTGKLNDVPNLLEVPIWTFYNADDFVQGPEEWRDFVDALEDAGANVTATEFGGDNHAIWNTVYEDPDYVNWLLTQLRDS